ncbi:hypothetical protein R6Q57_001249 [Mikania cordata]
MTGTRDLRDLLPTHTCAGKSNPFPAKPKEEPRPVENVELSLGLSLNGRFGSEPHRSVYKGNNNKLFRASSVTDLKNFPVDVELSLYTPLTRTCSLPPDTEVEWRKRKELQSFRRSEAKRKRFEKMKNVIADGNELCRVGLKQSPPSPAPVPAVLSPPSPPVRFSPQGSIGSQESGGSSGVSNLDGQPFAETNRDNEGAKVKKKVECNTNTKMKYDETMPYVSTKGEGPDGRRIQGFLYKYGKGEEVRIVCVCHGSFLTPAEFVKHGGGGDVDHPLRHIIVTSLFR